MAGEKDKLQNYFGFLQCNGNKDSFVQKWMMMVIVDRKAFLFFQMKRMKKVCMLFVMCVCCIYLSLFFKHFTRSSSSQVNKTNDQKLD